MIKLYDGGRFSGLLAESANGNGIKVGDSSRARGPTASSRCATRRRGGWCSSPAAPGWRRSSRCCARWPRRARPDRRRSTTARGREDDLFALEELERLAGVLPDMRFVPRSRRRTSETGWDGEAGLITDVVDRMEEDLAEVDAYLCGPPPMVDAAIALLERRGCAESHIYSTSSRPPRNDRGREEHHARRHDRDAGAQRPQAGVHRRGGRSEGVPVLAQPVLQLLRAAQAARERVRGRHRRRPARSRAPPDPGLGLRLRRRHLRLPAGVDRAEVHQLARSSIPTRSGSRRSTATTRTSCGRSAGRWPTPRPRAPTTRWNRVWVKVVERHVSAWAHAEHGLGMHVYTPAQRDAPTNMINNALAVGARPQAALRAGHHPVQPRALRADRGLRRLRAQGHLAERPGLAGRRARTSSG